MAETDQSIGREGQLTQDGLFVEAQPGVFFSPPLHATERLETSPEFRAYAERSRASLNPFMYVKVVFQQWRDQHFPPTSKE